MRNCQRWAGQSILPVCHSPLMSTYRSVYRELLFLTLAAMGKDHAGKSGEGSSRGKANWVDTFGPTRLRRRPHRCFRQEVQVGVRAPQWRHVQRRTAREASAASQRQSPGLQTQPPAAAPVLIGRLISGNPASSSSPALRSGAATLARARAPVHRRPPPLSSTATT